MHVPEECLVLIINCNIFFKFHLFFTIFFLDSTCVWEFLAFFLRLGSMESISLRAVQGFLQLFPLTGDYFWT